MKYLNVCNRAFVFICLFFSVNFVNANEATTADAGLQISPNRFDLVVTGGDERDIKINLHNYDDEAHEIEVLVEDFFVADDSMQPQFYVPDGGHERQAYDVINWVEVPESKFTLEGKGSKDVYFKVKVPENQPTNGYYGAIFFQTRTDDAMAPDSAGGVGAKIKVNYRIGSLLTFAVQGDEPMRIEGNLEEFDITKKIYWESPIELFAKLYSNGNIHYKVGGEMTVNRFGEKFAVVKVKDQILYPERTRTFKEKVEFGPWDFGIYTATLDMASEDGSVVFQGETETFYVIPWRTAMYIGIGILVLIIFIWFVKNFVHIGSKKSKKSKKKSKAKKEQPKGKPRTQSAEQPKKPVQKPPQQNQPPQRPRV